MTSLRKSPRRSNRRRPELDDLEARIVMSFADGNGAVVLDLAEQNDGSALVITFDGPLDTDPADAAESPDNVANYSIQLPSGNPEVVTGSLASIAIGSASYDSGTNQVTLNLDSPLAEGQSYRVFINGTPNTEAAAAPGLIDADQNPIDGDYDDTATGDFYALFAWTAAGTPIPYDDSQGDAISLSIAGPGQLNAWRALDGDFDAGDLTAQADLAAPLAVQQLSVTGGVAGETTLSGSAALAQGGDGVVVIPPTIPGAFTDALPSYFQPTAPASPTSPAPVVATATNFPFTIEIQPVNMPDLPALQSPVYAQDGVVGSPFQGDWLVFGGRTNGLHSFNGSDNFPPQDQNEAIDVINPTTGQVWSVAWSAADVPAGWLPPLYSTNQQSYQDGNTLYTVGGYGAVDQGGGNFADYTTYDTLTALSVDGMIRAVVGGGDVAAMSQIQQIQDPRLTDTGGEMSMLGGLTYLVLGQVFEGEYDPLGTTGFTQTYLDEIQAFRINYDGQVPNSLSISNYQAQNDQVNFRRRDYNLGNVVLPDGRPALEIYGGVFTPGPGTLAGAGGGYVNPILIQGIGETQVLPYQQSFNQYSSSHISLFDSSTGSMDTIFLGGISLYDANFATGQMILPLFNVAPYPEALPFVNDVTSLDQQGDGTAQEFEMADQLPGLFGAEASFFAAAGVSQFANGVLNLDALLAGGPTTLGYLYGGVVSTLGSTTNQLQQTAASAALFRIVLVPDQGRPTATTLVGSLYQTLLGRSPTPVEQNGWVTALNAGVPASRVAMSFIKSREHRMLELEQYFNEYLDAPLDPASERFYLRKFARGATQQQVIALILNSPQFSQQAIAASGETGNTPIVAALYVDLLNRGPTDSELADGVAELNAGRPLSALIRSIMRSDEYFTDEVDDDSTLYLGRPATPADERRGIKALRRESGEQYLASLLGSRIYYVNHPGVTGRTKRAAVTAVAK